MQPAVAEHMMGMLMLQGLTIQLGPDLRTVYPFMMTFNVSGQVKINGPADAKRLQLQGVIKLDSGEVSTLSIRHLIYRYKVYQLITDPIYLLYIYIYVCL